VMKEPFLALFENTTQWIFNKTLLYAGVATDANVHPKGENTAPHGLKPQYLQLVISASYDLVQRSRQEIINLGLRELNEILPLTREATLQKATVIKEINATFSPAPGVDRWRPQQHIGMDNLFLAGDWTSTGWPATMEGAVRSGYLAAEALLASLGRPRKFLQPDLPLQGLSRHWAMRERAAAT
jgi:uncharacterized protein with NAD-binding domain and iron-sulfur cluster